MSSRPLGSDKSVWGVVSTLTLDLGCGHCLGTSLSREVGGALVDKTHDKDSSAFTEGRCTATTMALTKQKEVYSKLFLQTEIPKGKKGYHHCFITG